MAAPVVVVTPPENYIPRYFNQQPQPQRSLYLALPPRRVSRDESFSLHHHKHPPESHSFRYHHQHHPQHQQYPTGDAAQQQATNRSAVTTVEHRDDAALALASLRNTFVAKPQPVTAAKSVRPHSPTTMTTHCAPKVDHLAAAVGMPVAVRNQRQRDVLHQYTVLTLERSSATSPWGLSICYLNNKTNTSSNLLISHVSKEIAMVQRCWVSKSQLSPSSYFHHHSSIARLPVPSLIRHLIQQRPVVVATTAAAAALNPSAAALTVGDCVLALAGIPVVQLGSLEAVIQVLQQHPGTTLELILYRNERALSAAAGALSAIADDVRRFSRGAYNAAQAAFDVIQTEWAPPDPSATPGTAAMTMAHPKPRTLFPADGSQSQAVAWDETSPAQHHPQQPIQQIQPQQVWVKPTTTTKMMMIARPKPVCPTKNKLFADPVTGIPGVVYVDENYEYDPDEGNRAVLFFPRIENFTDWLHQRKQRWRQHYTVCQIKDDWIQEDKMKKKKKRIGDSDSLAVADSSTSLVDCSDCAVAVDFWSVQGYANYQHWLLSRTAQWKAGYSWNLRKRKLLEHDCVEAVVHLPCSGELLTDQKSFDDWLRVRKNQWKLLRRKRQRRVADAVQMADQVPSPLPESMHDDNGDDDDSNSNEDKQSTCCALRRDTSMAPGPGISIGRRQQLSELTFIDALLEEQERERKAFENRPPLDIFFLFDADLGCPDDVVNKIFGYLDPMEHGKFLCINRETRQKLMKREQMWKQLSPSHWKLPRRPRKPWHELYRTNLRVETERSRKLWDDLLSRASQILLKADQLQSIEKLVTEAERNCNFDTNYVSGVVCERNSLLNLAVIHQRHSTYYARGRRSQHLQWSAFTCSLTISLHRVAVIL